MFRSLLPAAVALLVAHGPAYGYIDPNIGGWLYQLLFPLLVAIAGAWAAFRLKISELLSTVAKRLRGR